MDTLDIIMAALTGGAVAGIKDTASSAVKDAYAALKKRISKTTESNPRLNQALSEFEKGEPSAEDKATLRHELTYSQVERDSETLQLAKELMKVLRASKGVRVYDISISHAQGVVIGDNAQVQQSFEPLPTTTEDKD